MAPHQEDEDEAIDAYAGWWDWYQIGGRWTGWLTDYDPRVDPANVEQCTLCGGTGTRSDLRVANGCNGCGGRGMRLAWPTSWAPYRGDAQRWGDVKAYVMENNPHTVLTSAGAFHVEHYDHEARAIIHHPEDVVAALQSLSNDTTVVVVDYHS